MLDFWLVLHLLTAIMVAAGNLLALTTTVWARRLASPAPILALLRWHHRFVVALLVPGSIGVLVTGVALTHSTGTTMFAGWMIGTIVLWIVSLVIGLAVLVPAETRAIGQAAALAAGGHSTVTPELRREVAGAPIVIGEWAELGMVAAMFYLMTARPF